MKDIEVNQDYTLANCADVQLTHDQRVMLAFARDNFISILDYIPTAQEEARANLNRLLDLKFVEHLTGNTYHATFRGIYHLAVTS